MKLAIMQPYLFPYPGYFQLINAADKFIVYDDVAYIKQGWINRNKILLNEKEYVFTVPLKNASSYKLIMETEINTKLYDVWKRKFIQTLVLAYKNAPFFSAVISLVENVFAPDTAIIGSLACKSLQAVCDYTGIETAIVHTSCEYQNKNLKGHERIIDICRQESASTYINMIGGIGLYFKEDFSAAGLQLEFIKPRIPLYNYNGIDRIANLSIIDVLMFNSADRIRNMLCEYDLISA